MTEVIFTAYIVV